MTFAIKVHLPDPHARVFVFDRQKTMYDGKTITEGDTIFIFDSENENGKGLVAQGVVTAAMAVPRIPGVQRQTPLVSICVKRTGLAKRPLGRDRVKPFKNWKDGRPQTEINFKFYRQATNKIIGITDTTAKFLQSHFA